MYGDMHGIAGLLPVSEEQQEIIKNWCQVVGGTVGAEQPHYPFPSPASLQPLTTLNQHSWCNNNGEQYWSFPAVQCLSQKPAQIRKTKEKKQKQRKTFVDLFVCKRAYQNGAEQKSCDLQIVAPTSQLQAFSNGVFSSAPVSPHFE